MIEWYDGNENDRGHPDGIVRSVPHVKYPILVTESLRSQAQLYYGYLHTYQKEIVVSIIDASSIDGWVSELPCFYVFQNNETLRRT
jgi:hypothetical protein